MASKTFTIPTIFTAVDRFTKPVRAMQASMRGFAAQSEVVLARAERGWRNLISPLQKASNLLRYFGFFGAFAFVAAMGGAIKIVSNFQQANADLSSVLTNVSKYELMQMSESAKALGLTTARTATQVVGLQTELAKLGYTTPEILQMTGAMVRGSIAMDASLERTATLGGAMIRTFDNFKAADTPRIMDQMTLATLDTALSFEKLETMLPIVAGAANAVHVPFTKLLALLGKLSDAGIDPSSSATALRNIFIDSKRRGHDFEQVLANIQKKADRLTPAFNKFGKRGAVSAVVLANKLREVNAADLRYQFESSGVAAEAAAKRLNTFQGSLTLLKAAYQGFILTIDDGTGKYSATLKKIVDVTRGMLLMAAGTKEAMDAFGQLDSSTQKASERMMFWLGILKKAAIAIIAFKALTILARIALSAYSVVLGLSTSLLGVSTLALRGNALAMTVHAATTWGAVAAMNAMTIATELFWVATGPVGATIILLTALLDSFIRNWERLEKAMASGSVLNVLDTVAKIFNDAILWPIQQVFELLAKLPALLGGDIFAQMALGIQRIRGAVAFGPEEDPEGEDDGYIHTTRNGKPFRLKRALNPDAVRADQFLQQHNREQFEASMLVEFNGPPGFTAKSTSPNVEVKPKNSSTMGWGNQ